VSGLFTNSLVARSVQGDIEGNVTGLQKAIMNYVNYEHSIIQRYKIKLVGWTYKDFVNPADINTVVDIRALRDALKTGACHWITLSTQELKDHVQGVETRRENGEVVGKTRKERSDKGVKRKRRVLADKNNVDLREKSSKRSKTAKTIERCLPPKSKAIIDDDDDDDDNNSETENRA
jgi:hypothetical protein